MSYAARMYYILFSGTPQAPLFQKAYQISPSEIEGDIEREEKAKRQLHAFFKEEYYICTELMRGVELFPFIDW